MHMPLDTRPDPDPLNAFVARAQKDRRIRFADVRRLQRVILPDGIRNRAEAEALIALDRSVPSADKSWPGYLVPAVRDFVVRGGEAPALDGDTTAWLIDTLGTGKATKTVVAIARAIVRSVEVERA